MSFLPCTNAIQFNSKTGSDSGTLTFVIQSKVVFTHLHSTGGPPLTRKLLTRFPLPHFLAYARVSGGISASWGPQYSPTNTNLMFTNFANFWPPTYLCLHWLTFGLPPTYHYTCKCLHLKIFYSNPKLSMNRFIFVLFDFWLFLY